MGGDNKWNWSADHGDYYRIIDRGNGTYDYEWARSTLPPPTIPAPPATTTGQQASSSVTPTPLNREYNPQLASGPAHGSSQPYTSPPPGQPYSQPYPQTQLQQYSGHPQSQQSQTTPVPGYPPQTTPYTQQQQPHPPPTQYTTYQFQPAPQRGQHQYNNSNSSTAPSDRTDRSQGSPRGGGYH